MEFHVSKKVRDKYGFDESIFESTGNVILARFHDARMFAHKMNMKKDIIQHPEQAIKTGQLNAMGLIDEILHYIIFLYRQEINPEIMKKCLSSLEDKYGKEKLDRVLYQFTEEFPPVKVYKNEISLNRYFQGSTDGVSNRQIILEEMLMLQIANENQAFSPYSELFDDKNLKEKTVYNGIIDHIHNFFNTQKPFGPDNQNLIDMIRSPAIAEPHSLQGQINYIIEKWGFMLGKFLFRLLSSLDLIREEEKMRGFGKPLLVPYDFSYETEYERFSADKEWMPKLVLIAKHTLVWLDQLSAKYHRAITKLDQIPDEELDILAGWGFTGLWLIGVWERSSASKLIKHHCGNPDAEASAYSVYDYVVAGELGGYEALVNLRDRCWRRGIRLASDMVPNHTGIFSKWTIEHPDWYVQAGYPPFPSYSFTGHNYSEDQRVGIFIEDHYYNRTDAAVVFKRVDFYTGETRYIYHGNDGTHMPWNDTAQLNFLNQEAREAVIRTILHVAHLFPIIRFDAAMTLAKRHYQRLWFPPPGSGGDIPSRAEFGITKHDFNEAFPNEFWREVVDRVAKECPDTLLLAEAFWLMEGYFVRTLGMHRVYNSAFMNMLKMEDNQKYRLTIKNTMEFDPEILKRFVNFMNNPDEDTAVAQFGKEDKYFGICLMMSTMPGLPMFGHGQIEGFTEKYGMEYRKAYWNEIPDWHLVQRHEREIFPLLKKRYIFAHVHNFLLYDFYAPEGWVNENVFAYSNSHGPERGLIVYNNKYEFAKGWIKTSAAFVVKTPDGGKFLTQKVLGEGLSLHNDGNYYCIFRDHISNLEYIRNSKELWDCGLYIELGAFKYHAFLDFREVGDNEYHHYSQLASTLHGRGVLSVDDELKEIFLKEVYHTLYTFLNKAVFTSLRESRACPDHEAIFLDLIDAIERSSYLFYQAVTVHCGGKGDAKRIASMTRKKLEIIQNLEALENQYSIPKKGKTGSMITYFEKGFKEIPYIFEILYGWVFFHSTGTLSGTEHWISQSRSWLDEWLFGKKVHAVFRDTGMNEDDAWKCVDIIKILTSHQKWFVLKGLKKNYPYIFMNNLLCDQDIIRFLKVNRYENILWFNKEAFEYVMWWLFIATVIDVLYKEVDDAEIRKKLLRRYTIIEKCLKAESESGFQVEKLLACLKADI
ncbi:MAG: alpha-amylase [Spirochaetales bacterium]|nr:alpha-amylase [Spirochaetales bacterium]